MLFGVIDIIFLARLASTSETPVHHDRDIILTFNFISNNNNS